VEQDRRAAERARQGARRWWILVPALPLLVVCLGGTHAAAHNQATDPQPYAYLLAGFAALTLLLRRRAPLVGMSAAALATAAYLLLDQPYGPILFAAPAWAWCLTAVLPLRRAVPWLAGYLALVVVAAAPRHVERDGWGGLLIWAAAMAFAIAAGAATGFALAARQRSEAAARAEIARRAVSEERLAMAQDVHDGVGHSLAVIAMQAGVAAHVLERDPARARELLATVVATSREALDGLRADLDRLRTPADSAARRPAPGLADLPVLLDRMRDGGLQLSVSLPGAAAVPPDVGAAAYRIVQESLTNVLRHAGTSEASVRVSVDGAVRVEVADRGSGPGAAEGGSGIAGMRRRAESVGGRLTAGPRDGGGFLVFAELPA
jgi:signal transduction histidine kinase